MNGNADGSAFCITDGVRERARDCIGAGDWVDESHRGKVTCGDKSLRRSGSVAHDEGLSHISGG